MEKVEESWSFSGLVIFFGLAYVPHGTIKSIQEYGNSVRAFYIHL